MVKRKKAKKVSKKRSPRSKRASSNSSSIPNIIYLAVAAIVVFAAFAFTGSNKSSVNNQGSKQIQDSKVSDIKETREVSVKLNIPKKKKSINQKSFNEKEIQIRFAEIDWNSDKQISRKEYLYYFKNKSAGKRQFKRVDRNGSGSISYKEYLAFKKR